MKNYAAEMDRILAEHSAATRAVHDRFFDADARTTRGGAELADQLREQFRARDEPPDEPSAAAQARAEWEEAERDRLLREAAERKAARERTQPTGRVAEVFPSDWTEEDQARAEGYGPPASWLT